MKGQKTPSRKRSAQCPQCGLYFAPAGLTGHTRFYHAMGIGQKKKGPLDNELDKYLALNRARVLDLVRPDPTTGALLTKEAADAIFQLLLLEYIFGKGIFAQK